MFNQGAGHAAQGRHAARAVARPAEAPRDESPVFARVLDDVHEQVRAGTALSDAFAAHGDLFPRVYTASLLAGERSGNLDAVLRRYVEYTKIIATVKRKTVSALVYPAILISLALGLVSIIVLKVVPAFADFYTSFGAHLPPVTRVIVATLDAHPRAVHSHPVALVAGPSRSWPAFSPGRPAGAVRPPDAAAAGARPRSRASSRPRRWRARWRRCSAAACRSSTRSTSPRGRSAISTWPASSTSSASGCAKGSRSPAALEARRAFPDVAVKMAEVGESTGALQDMLNTVADFYDEEISTNMERFITLVEPVLLVVMGIVIAGLLLALYMPLFQLSSVRGPVITEHRCHHADPADVAAVSDAERLGPSWSRRGGWRSATASSSSTWTRSGSIRICSGRSRRT